MATNVLKEDDMVKITEDLPQLNSDVRFARASKEGIYLASGLQLRQV